MDNVVLITGANGETGINLALSLRENSKLILTWNKHNGRLKDNMSLLSSCDLYQANLSKEDETAKLFKYIYNKYSHLDLIVNCVGRNIKIQDDLIDDEIWDVVLSDNLKPVLYIGRYYKKYIKEDQKGCWINFSSTAGIRGLPSSPHYIVSKAGVISLSEYYAKILAPNIRVNVIAPGFINTTDHRIEKYDTIRESTLLKRLASFDNICTTVNYLKECDFMTGQTIILDGGLIL